MKSSVKIKNKLESKGYAKINSEEFQYSQLELNEFIKLKEDWGNLPIDDFLMQIDLSYENKTYRLRRWGRYKIDIRKSQLTQLKHRPFFQSETYNKGAGGIERNFAPIVDKTYENIFLKNLIFFNVSNLPLKLAEISLNWEIYLHQIKVITQSDFSGKPAPEGIHQDDVEFFSVHLIERNNYKGGEVQVYNLEKELLHEISLDSVMDSYYISDKKVMHGVREITPISNEMPGERSVLIISYKSV